MAFPNPCKESVPMAVTQEEARRAQMKRVAEAYFEGMGKKDMSQVPWDDLSSCVRHSPQEGSTPRWWDARLSSPGLHRFFLCSEQCKSSNIISTRI